MQSVAYVLSHFVAPFLAGVFMAALASTSNPVSALVFLVLAGVSGFVILPRNALSMVRLVEGLRA